MDHGWAQVEDLVPDLGAAKIEAALLERYVPESHLTELRQALLSASAAVNRCVSGTGVVSIDDARAAIAAAHAAVVRARTAAQATRSVARGVRHQVAKQEDRMHRWRSIRTAGRDPKKA
jgi:hypothetical protein